MYMRMLFIVNFANNFLSKKLSNVFLKKFSIGPGNFGTGKIHSAVARRVARGSEGQTW